MSRKKIWIYRILAGALIAGSLALMLVYRYPLIRLGESLRDFGKAFVYFVADIFDAAEKYAAWQTINRYSSVDLEAAISVDFEEIYTKLCGVWQEIFVAEHFAAYLIYLLWRLTRFLYWTCWAMISVMVAAVPVVLTWEDENNDYGEDTPQLRFFKRYVVAPFRQAVEEIRMFLAYFRHGWRPVFLSLWIVTFGIPTAIIEFLAYYFWILTAFDISTIGIQIVKLIVDFLLMLHTLPGVFWFVAAVILFDRWRVRHGMNFLHHAEMKARGFVADLPICSFLTAPPRTGKTTGVTDLALSCSALFRYKALELMENNMLKFPEFPWILFEKQLQAAIEEHRAYNLATVREWVGTFRLMAACNPDYLGGYLSFGQTYNDGLTVSDLWEILTNYAQEYFIYTLESSLIVSNYAVREDFLFDDIGNFPLVDQDFFARDPATLEEDSTFSHLIDFDALRLGRKMQEDNPHTGGLEIGVILMSEIDKERKNNLELQEMKKKEDGCNQKNDMFNQWLKMCGHSAMVENFCFLKIFTDAQRPSSWGADARELSTVLHIVSRGEDLNALPLFWIEQAVFGGLLSLWQGVWEMCRYRWGNSRLLSYLGQGLASVLYGYLLRRGNLFGYHSLHFIQESGTLENENVEEKDVIICHKKIYADRFASDYFRSFSEAKAKACPTGINDLPEYSGLYPSLDEMQHQNSHFMKELNMFFGSDPKE